MSLAKPKSPVFVTESDATSSDSVGMLDANENATRVNQLHGIASNNALGAGIPSQVSNVQASIANAQTGSTCTVSILFRQDPTDKNFAGVNIWVKGYQGNNQLVRVASGVGSPTKFVLNNTGEIVSFVIQAYGNGGGAPLTSAPSCSGTLPQSKSGGFGSSTVVTPSVTLQTNGANNASQSVLNVEQIDSSIQVTNISGGNVAIQGPQYGKSNPSRWTSGDGSFFRPDPTSSGAFQTGTANQVKFWMVETSVSRTILKLTLRVNNFVAGSKFAFGVYSANGATKLLSWDNIDPTGGGTKTTTLGAAVILPPGNYLIACGSDNTGVTNTIGGYDTAGTNEPVMPWNTNGTIRTGVAANAMSSGNMPSSLGALSVSASIQTIVPLVLMEP